LLLYLLTAKIAVSQIWSAVFGIHLIGVNDNFFDLGENSLLATQVISRTEEVFEIQLSLRHLFEAPTIAFLVQVIHTVRLARSQSQSETLPPLVAIEHKPYVVRSFAQEYMCLLITAGLPQYLRLPMRLWLYVLMAAFLPRC